MKNNKNIVRLMVTILLVAMVCSLVPMMASAAAFTVSIDSVSALPGETVTVPIRFTNVPMTAPSYGVYSSYFAVSFDETKIDDTTATANQGPIANAARWSVVPVSVLTASSPYRVNIAYGASGFNVVPASTTGIVITDGIFANLQLTIRPDCPLGTEIPLNIVDGSVARNFKGGKLISGKVQYDTTLNAATVIVAGKITVGSPVTVAPSPADTEAPVVHLTGNATEAVAYNGSYTDAGATVTDNKDTGLTATVTIKNPSDVTVSSFDSKVSGAWKYLYDAVDAAGNHATQVIRTVNVAADTRKTGKDITSFTIAGVTADIAGTNITATVPYNTNVTSLTPVIQVSDGASITETGARNFSGPITYTVTAENGDSQTYTVTVTVAADTRKTGKDIISFTVAGQTVTPVGTDITVNVPFNTNVTALTPVVVVSDGASYTPAGAQNFTTAQTYTVKAENGDEKAYTVTITKGSTPTVNIAGPSKIVRPSKFYSSKQYSFTVSGTKLADELDWALTDGSDVAITDAGISKAVVGSDLVITIGNSATFSGTMKIVASYLGTAVATKEVTVAAPVSISQIPTVAFDGAKAVKGSSITFDGATTTAAAGKEFYRLRVWKFADNYKSSALVKDIESTTMPMAWTPAAAGYYRIGVQTKDLDTNEWVSDEKNIWLSVFDTNYEKPIVQSVTVEQVAGQKVKITPVLATPVADVQFKYWIKEKVDGSEWQIISTGNNGYVDDASFTTAALNVGSKYMVSVYAKNKYSDIYNLESYAMNVITIQP